MADVKEKPRESLTREDLLELVSKLENENEKLAYRLEEFTERHWCGRFHSAKDIVFCEHCGIEDLDCKIEEHELECAADDDGNEIEEDVCDRCGEEGCDGEVVCIYCNKVEDGDCEKSLCSECKQYLEIQAMDGCSVSAKTLATGIKPCEMCERPNCNENCKSFMVPKESVIHGGTT